MAEIRKGRDEMRDQREDGGGRLPEEWPALEEIRRRARCWWRLAAFEAVLLLLALAFVLAYR